MLPVLLLLDKGLTAQPCVLALQCFQRRLLLCCLLRRGRDRRTGSSAWGLQSEFVFLLACTFAGKASIVSTSSMT